MKRQTLGVLLADEDYTVIAAIFIRDNSLLALLGRRGSTVMLGCDNDVKNGGVHWRGGDVVLAGHTGFLRDGTPT